MSAPESSEVLVKLHQVGKAYKKGKELVKVLANLNLEIKRGDFRVESKRARAFSGKTGLQTRQSKSFGRVGAVIDRFV